MKLRLPLLLAGVLFAASATSAMAQGAYIGVSGGVTFVHESDVDFAGGSDDLTYDAGGAFNIAAGMKMNQMRGELEFGYKEADFDEFNDVPVDGDLSVMSYMANGYYDFMPVSGFTPFLGAGIGFVNGEFSSGGVEDDDTVFGYQLMAGASFRMSPAVNLDVSYRFQSAPTDFESEGDDISYNSSSILAGFRFSFY